MAPRRPARVAAHRGADLRREPAAARLARRWRTMLHAGRTGCMVYVHPDDIRFPGMRFFYGDNRPGSQLVLSSGTFSNKLRVRLP